MSYNPAQVAFIDTETTGLDPELHDIWEIAVIVDDTEHVWQQRLPIVGVGGTDVGWADTLDPWIIENTGILDRYDHDTALDGLESMGRFLELVGNRHLVGACPWFDSERLHRMILRSNEPGRNRQHPWHYHLIDVETLAVGYMAGFHEAGWHAGFHELEERGLPWKSTDLSLALGVDPDAPEFMPKHSALADARWAKAIFDRIMG